MRKLTTEEFIVRAKEAHGDRYSYDKTKYINNKTKVIITCPTHDEFEQKPKSHLDGQGCPSCGGTKKLHINTFVLKSKVVHGNMYKYDKTKYINNKTKVIITCSEHGDFIQIPYHHLKGVGCPSCAGLKKLTTEEFIRLAKTAHGDKYDYSKVEYLNSRAKIIITCPVHGDFEQRAQHHLHGSGCPNCAVTGFDQTKPGYLYYLKITTDDGQTLYKIGITNRTVNERFNLTDLNKIEILKQKQYAVGQDAYEWEQKLLKLYKQYQYKGTPVLSSGNTELFTEDIVTMYYKDNNF